jgi:hypothetical protein
VRETETEIETEKETEIDLGTETIEMTESFEGKVLNQKTYATTAGRLVTGKSKEILKNIYSVFNIFNIFFATSPIY